MSGFAAEDVGGAMKRFSQYNYAGVAGKKRRKQKLVKGWLRELAKVSARRLII